MPEPMTSQPAQPCGECDGSPPLDTRATIQGLTQPGFDRDVPVVLSDALSGPGCVSNISVTRRGLLMSIERVIVIDHEGYGFNVALEGSHISGRFIIDRRPCNLHSAAVQILRHGRDLPRTYISGWDGRDLPANSELESLIAISADTFCRQCGSLSGVHDPRCASHIERFFAASVPRTKGPWNEPPAQPSETAAPLSEPAVISELRDLALFAHSDDIPLAISAEEAKAIIAAIDAQSARITELEGALDAFQPEIDDCECHWPDGSPDQPPRRGKCKHDIARYLLAGAALRGEGERP